ncbi:T9SS C-terminal target domain-containing protein [Halogeometricum sp. CBA1124]|uniref:T9SS C-terminal target domain-containing protein n=1 Tax=Halogeometricum sp. CBA1124 TaxID=2668071 RepID=UPI00142B77D1|nr:T9SS C-terminal target domain-containing protein [Halogeometricum sp. CBA1124]MUV57067.1 T9SS C-terminal target domain-containing protein [Halogeometricum sp. CBA1124]
MKRLLVVLTCITVLLAGISASAVVAQSTETTDTAADDYSLDTPESVPVHDRQVTVDGATTNVSSLVGLYPGEEAVVEVTAPDDELAVVTVRTPDGTVVQKDSLTTGETVLVDGSDYERGTYHLVLSTGGQVRTVSLLVVSKYEVSYGLNNVTADGLTGDATVAGGVADGEAVQFVLSNDEGEVRTNASEVRRGLYDFDLSLEDVPDGNYTALVEVVNQSGDGASAVLATSQVRTLTVGDAGGDENATAGSDAAAADATATAVDDSASAPAQTAADDSTAGTADGQTGASAESNSTVPEYGPVALFALLVSWAVVARVRRRR